MFAVSPSSCMHSNGTTSTETYRIKKNGLAAIAARHQSATRVQEEIYGAGTRASTNDIVIIITERRTVFSASNLKEVRGILMQPTCWQQARS